jgi:hypothetical protein
MYYRYPQSPITKKKEVVPRHRMVGARKAYRFYLGRVGIVLVSRNPFGFLRFIDTP